ncbi:MAG: hypothetical protein FJ246_00195 [Nitrospira sp.]|nr:hypothetical protein [Nitrospira sp.]
MTLPPQTPAQAAQALYAILPHAMTQAALEEYGIDAAPEQAQQITRELLSVNLYWVQSALQMVLTKTASERVLLALREHLRSVWETDLGLNGQDVQGYFEEAEERRHTYDLIVQEGGAPVAVFTECAGILESAWALRAEDRSKALALFIDLVPVDEIGEVLEGSDLGKT